METVIHLTETRHDAICALSIQGNAFCNETNLMLQFLCNDIKMPAGGPGTLLDQPLQIIVHEPILLH